MLLRLRECTNRHIHAYELMEEPKCRLITKINRSSLIMELRLTGIAVAMESISQRPLREIIETVYIFDDQSEPLRFDVGAAFAARAKPFVIRLNFIFYVNL